MKRSQRIMIGIGVLIVFGMCIMPPFHFHRSNKYLPIWANTVGSLDTTRLCVQIGAVAILTGGLVFLAKRKWRQGNDGKIIPWGKVGAIDVSIAIMIAAVVTILAITWIERAKANQLRVSGEAETARLLTSVDLSKVKLEPLEIWADKYLKCRLYNGTDKALDEVQVSLYVRKTSGRIVRMGVEGKRYRTADEFFNSSPRIKLSMAESEFAASAVPTRVYKQSFSFIGTVPQHSWSEVNIELSNCPEAEDRSRWVVLLKAARWQKASN